MRHPLVETEKEKNHFDFCVENHVPLLVGMQIVDLAMLAHVNYVESAAVNFAAPGEDCFADKPYTVVADVKIDALVLEGFESFDSAVLVAPAGGACAVLPAAKLAALMPAASADLDAASSADSDAASYAVVLVSLAHAVAEPVLTVNFAAVQPVAFASSAVENTMASAVPLDDHVVEDTDSLAAPAVVELVLPAAHPEALLHLVALNGQRELQPSLVW